MKHKPIRKTKWGTETQRRIPHEGPLTPRLRVPLGRVEAIGFQRLTIIDEE